MEQKFDSKETPNKYQQAFLESKVETNDAVVAAEVEKILKEHIAENDNKEVYQFLLNCVDLTTLSTTDSERSVAAFTKKVNDYWTNYPQYKNVAAICVYSNFAEVVRGALEVSDVNIAVCSAAFPSSQAHIETKVAETALAIEDGADEVDIVINMGYYLDEAYEELCDEIAEIKATMGDHHLKVILETGCLKTAENIKRASILSMYSGADFIKTSTGKIYEGATLEAAYVMCQGSPTNTSVSVPAVWQTPSSNHSPKPKYLHSKSPIPHQKSGAPKKGSVFLGSQRVNKFGLSGIRIIELSNYRDFGIRGGRGNGDFWGKNFVVGGKIVTL